MKLLALALICLSSAANAQASKCMARPFLIEQLGTEYGEHLTGLGLQGPQQMLEVWVSDKTGSFTLIVTRADGTSCIVATGKNWRSLEPPIDGDPT